MYGLCICTGMWNVWCRCLGHAHRERTRAQRLGVGANPAPFSHSRCDRLECSIGRLPFLPHPLHRNRQVRRVSSSVAVLAEILLRPPQKLFIFIIKKIVCWVKSIQK